MKLSTADRQTGGQAGGGILPLYQFLLWLNSWGRCATEVISIWINTICFEKVSTTTSNSSHSPGRKGCFVGGISKNSAVNFPWLFRLVLVALHFPNWFLVRYFVLITQV